jgi:hypothetical protein
MLAATDPETRRAACSGVRGIGLAAAEPGIVRRLIHLLFCSTWEVAENARLTLDHFMLQGARFFPQWERTEHDLEEGDLVWIVRTVADLTS